MAEGKPEGKLDFDDETSTGEENKLLYKIISPQFFDFDCVRGPVQTLMFS